MLVLLLEHLKFQHQNPPFGRIFDTSGRHVCTKLHLRRHFRSHVGTLLDLL